MGNKKHTAKMINQRKQSRAKTMKSQKQTIEDSKYVKNTCLTNEERKTIRRDDLRSKLTLNHFFGR